MTVQVIAMVEVRDPDLVAEYFKVTLPLMEQAGAKVVNQYAFGDPVVGESRGETIYVVEYPDFDAVDAVFQSPEYEAVKPIRDRGFSKYSVSFAAT